MITPALLQQAIRETAEGMLSGDPDYAAECVQTRAGARVRVWMIEKQSSAIIKYPVYYSYEIKNKPWAHHRCNLDGEYLDQNFSLVSAQRIFKC